MPKEFRHYKVLKDQLTKLVDEKTGEKVLLGMDYVKDSSKPEVKAGWAFEVVKRMDENIDEKTCISIRENCACLLSNEKSIYAKEFARLRKQSTNDDEYLSEVIKYLNQTQPLRRCGDVRIEDGKVYSTIGRDKCACSVLIEGLKQPISKTWCHCCKGSLLSVYRYVFKDKICNMDIVETVATGGSECTFVTTYR